VPNTTNIRKAKYTLAETPRNSLVDMARSVKMAILMIREAIIRFGYDARAWSFVRTNIEPRLVIVDTDSSADWKFLRIGSFDSNRC
jgi:hypothetical protein